MNKTLGIIGSGSMVASQACSQFEKDGTNLVKADLNGLIKIDITNPDSVEAFFNENNFDYAVLFSAFTDVNGAEKQRDDKEGICWKINVEGLKNVADATYKFNKKLIFFSTDFIFDGTSGPYLEDDPVGTDMQKVGWYSKTKIEGENYIKENMKPEDFLIIRISFPFSGKDVGKEDFALKTVNLHKSGSLYPMYDDQIITPTFIPDIAPALTALIEADKSGIFHLASPETTTPYDFSKYLLSKFEGKDIEVEKGSLQKQLDEGGIPRPLKSGLKTDKIEQVFKPTTWQEAIDKLIPELKSN